MAIDAYISFNLLIKQGFSFYREVDYHQGMWNLNYDSPKEIERVLNERGLAMSKKFGQNFLISPEGRKRLIDLMIRRGTYSNTQYHIKEAYKLKEYIDNLLGYNLYDLFPEIKDNL